MKLARPGRVAVMAVFPGLPIAAAAVAAFSYLAFAALPPVPQPPENPITESKRVLGKILFAEEQISTSNSVSCATCHLPQRGGTDPRLARNPGLDGLINSPDDIFGSPGIIHSDANNDYVRDPVFGLAPQITGRSANSNINAGYATDLFWDGRARSQFIDPETGQVAIIAGGALESQAAGPIVNSIEMAHDAVNWAEVTEKLARVMPLDLATNHPPDVAAALQGKVDYPELFRRAFGDDAITASRIAFAMATYQRTLVADQTPWDRFQAGDQAAMTQPQKDGFAAFQASNCTVCHTAPLFSDLTFRNIGVRPIVEDTGRQIVTGNINDRGKFKVPSLRNVGLKRSFMHNGQFQNVGQVIGFYNAPPLFPNNRDPVLQTVNVPPGAVPLVNDFLVNALTDPRVAGASFPFDRPLLFTDRPQDQPSIIGGGVAGSGGILPRIIVQGPPMVGNLDYRVGLDGALGGASAVLGISTVPPVAGRITPERFVGQVFVSGLGTNQGPQTLKWPLLPGQVTAGEVVFAQWFVTDAGAAGGQALSAVARIPVFCGSSGCPCSSADFDRDGDTGTDLDIEAFFSCLGGNCCPLCGSADFDGNGDSGTDEDIEAFFRVLGGGAC